MDEHLQVLSELPECPLDIVFATQVKLQLIVDQINQTEWQHHDGSFRRTGSQPSLTSFYTNALRTKVEAARAAIPPALQDHGKHHHIIQCRFHLTPTKQQ